MTFANGQATELMAAIVLAAGAALVFGLLVRKLLANNRDTGSAAAWSADWVRDFSTARYAPMGRLLDESEFQFLRAQRGYDESIEKKLRAERRMLYRRYLAAMRRDFDRLFAALKHILLYFPQDRPDLASELVKVRFGFRVAMLRAELRLALHWLGVNPADVRDLVGRLEFLRGQIGQIVSPRAEI